MVLHENLRALTTPPHHGAESRLSPSAWTCPKPHVTPPQHF